MPSLSGNLRARPDLRVRPVPEWDACVVYDPGRRRLTELNLTAALVLELCRDTGYRPLREAFGRAIGPRLDGQEIDRLLRASVMQLLGAGLVVRAADEARGDGTDG